MSKELDLSGFTGTEHYYRYHSGVYLTDGTAYLAKEAGCLWLMDMIVSYLPTIPSDESFVVMTLQRNKNGGADFGLTDDIPAKRWYAAQHIEWTDFPLDEITLYVERGEDAWVVLLTSEH